MNKTNECVCAVTYLAVINLVNGRIMVVNFALLTNAAVSEYSQFNMKNAAKLNFH